MFDPLENKRLDRTTSVVLYFSKLFLGLDKLRAKRTEQKSKFLSPLNHETTFCPSQKLSKIPK
jgi:hypothetical protein